MKKDMTGHLMGNRTSREDDESRRKDWLVKGESMFGYPELAGIERKEGYSFKIFTSKRGRRFISEWFRKLCWEFQIPCLIACPCQIM